MQTVNAHAGKMLHLAGYQRMLHLAGYQGDASQNTARQHCTPVSTAGTQNTASARAGRMWGSVSLSLLTGQPLWKTVGRFLGKLNILLPRGPPVVTLRI